MFDKSLFMRRWGSFFKWITTFLFWKSDAFEISCDVGKIVTCSTKLVKRFINLNLTSIFRRRWRRWTLILIIKRSFRWYGRGSWCPLLNRLIYAININPSLNRRMSWEQESRDSRNVIELQVLWILIEMILILHNLYFFQLLFIRKVFLY